MSAQEHLSTYLSYESQQQLPIEMAFVSEGNIHSEVRRAHVSAASDKVKKVDA